MDGGGSKNANQPDPAPSYFMRLFRFLDLPAELRLRVYGYVFANGKIRINRKICITPSAPDLDIVSGREIESGLLTVSRQVHNEALPEFFKLTTLTTEVPDCKKKKEPDGLIFTLLLPRNLDTQSFTLKVFPSFLSRLATLQVTNFVFNTAMIGLPPSLQALVIGDKSGWATQDLCLTGHDKKTGRKYKGPLDAMIAMAKE